MSNQSRTSIYSMGNPISRLLSYLPIRFGLYVAIFLIIVSLCQCSSTYYVSPVKSTVSEGAPVGYIQFYNGPKIISPLVFRTLGGKTGLEEQWKIADVLEVTSGKEKKIGEVQRAQVGLTAGFLRIATTPGEHHYILKIGFNKPGELVVNVKQDRMTPIRIDIAKMGQLDDKAIEYSIRIEKLPTFCFGKKEAIDSLVNCLKDEDWEKRWLSVFLLGDIKAVQSEEALKSLIIGEPDEYVKTYAKWSLEVFQKEKGKK